MRNTPNKESVTGMCATWVSQQVLHAGGNEVGVCVALKSFCSRNEMNRTMRGPTQIGQTPLHCLPMFSSGLFQNCETCANVKEMSELVSTTKYTREPKASLWGTIFVGSFTSDLLCTQVSPRFSWNISGTTILHCETLQGFIYVSLLW
jgi:hypothetical protein